MKKWYSSKVIWLAVVQGIAGIVLVVSHEYPTVGWIAVVKSALDFGLRLTTTAPINS